MAEDRIRELETQIGKLQAQQADLSKQLIKARIENWQGRIDDLEVQITPVRWRPARSSPRSWTSSAARRLTEKQWEAAISTAASVGDTVHTGLESACRDLRNALLEAKNKLASSHS